MGAGSRPGGRGTCSLLRQRKVPKRKATRSLGPLRCAAGQPAVLECSGVWRNSLRSDMRQPLSAAPCAPRPSPTGLAVPRAFAALGHQRRARCARHAGGKGFAIYLIAVCARPTCAKCQFHLKTRRSAPAPAHGGRAQQRPVRYANPWGWAEEHSFKWIRTGTCLSAASCVRPHLKRAPQVAPQRSAGDPDFGSPFLCLLSFGEAKESESAAGASPGLRPQNSSTGCTAKSATQS